MGLIISTLSEKKNLLDRNQKYIKPYRNNDVLYFRIKYSAYLFIYITLNKISKLLKT